VPRLVSTLSVEANSRGGGGPSFHAPNIVVAEAHDGGSSLSNPGIHAWLRVYKCVYGPFVPLLRRHHPGHDHKEPSFLYCRVSLSSSAIRSSGVLATRLDAGTAPLIDFPNLSYLSNPGYWTIAPPVRACISCPFPVAKQLGVHEVHYAMVVILAMGISLFAPPFGLGYYAACSIGQVDPNAGLKRIWSYLAALVVGLLVVAFVPWISTGFLP